MKIILIMYLIMQYKIIIMKRKLSSNIEKGQFKNSLNVNTEQTEPTNKKSKMATIYKNTEPLAETVLLFFELDELKEVGDVIDGAYLNYYEKYENIKYYIKNSTDIFTNLKKSCKSNEMLNVFDHFIFEILEIHFYNYDACINWIEFHKNEPVKYLMGYTDKGIPCPYKNKNTQLQQLIFEICYQFINNVKTEYKFINNQLKSWYDLPINGHDSQISILKRTVTQNVLKDIQNNQHHNHKCDYDVDYILYTKLVEKLPKNHLLKNLDESKYDKYFESSKFGRVSRRKWILENLHNLEFDNIKRKKYRFKYYTTLINYNINNNKYKEQIKQLNENDKKEYKKIDRILKAEVQTSEFETLIDNYMLDVNMYFNEIFQ